MRQAHGHLDLPAPLLSWLDGGLGAVEPPTLRLALRGLIGGVGALLASSLALKPVARIE